MGKWEDEQDGDEMFGCMLLLFLAFALFVWAVVWAIGYAVEP